jgi:hypothetical protein
MIPVWEYFLAAKYHKYKQKSRGGNDSSLAATGSSDSSVSQQMTRSRIEKSFQAAESQREMRSHNREWSRLSLTTYN